MHELCVGGVLRRERGVGGFVCSQQHVTFFAGLNVNGPPTLQLPSTPPGINRFPFFGDLIGNGYLKTGNEIYAAKAGDLITDWVLHLVCHPCKTSSSESPWRRLEQGGFEIESGFLLQCLAHVLICLSHYQGSLLSSLSRSLSSSPCAPPLNTRHLLLRYPNVRPVAELLLRTAKCVRL